MPYFVFFQNVYKLYSLNRINTEIYEFKLKDYNKKSENQKSAH